MIIEKGYWLAAFDFCQVLTIMNMVAQPAVLRGEQVEQVELLQEAHTTMSMEVALAEQVALAAQVSFIHYFPTISLN